MRSEPTPTVSDSSTTATHVAVAELTQSSPVTPAGTQPSVIEAASPLGRCLDKAVVDQTIAALHDDKNPEAERLEATGWKHYLAKQQPAAIEAYCGAIALVPSGAVYYKLGNALQNSGALEDAVRAYELALHLHHATPERVHYNLACAYSRLQQPKEAFAALDLAFDTGYAAVAKFKTDPDLDFLRRHPDWEKHAERYYGAPEAFIGEYVKYEERDFQTHIAFCPDNRVVMDEHSSVDRSCCEARAYGTLVEKDGKFFARWEKLCGKRGEGKPRPRGGEDWCTVFPKCSRETTCQDLSGKRLRELVSKAQLAGIKTSKAPETPDVPQEVFIQRGKSVPRACSAAPQP